MSDKKIVLTGIKPTGMPHLGNYLGAIAPALNFGDQYETRFFIADYHSLNSVKDGETLRNYIYEIAACWLACGLDPEKSLIYKQSDIPEVFELTTLIMAFTSKGLMNRAHAYKACVDVNKAADNPVDHNINMGLFTYPVLMAADILMFDSDLVPVGKDQVQHLEMAADIAEAVNRNYGKDLLKSPKAFVSDDTKTILGMDGRKMSKSYGNTIPLFIPEKKLKKMLNKIVTNSQGVEEAKDPETCTVFNLFKLFSTAEQQETLAKRYRDGGMGWGDAKGALFEAINKTIGPFRERYDELMADKSVIDKILAEGAEKARVISRAKIQMLRKEIGVTL